MKKLIFTQLLILISLSLQAQLQLAFPSAEGFGKYASGGRMGKVYIVTNLNDSGEGSLRDAVSESHRIVVFEVGGVIEITSPIVFAPNITIAGQTAPAPGITVYGDCVSFTNANNLICRYMRFRMGESGRKGGDAATIANGYNMIFDHVSVSWGKDENFSISSMAVVGGPSHITVQNSIIAQGLGEHSMGGLIQSDGGITLYRNLYIDNRSRNVKAKGVNQFANNVVYNWAVGAYILGDSEFSSFSSVTDNYFIYGPSTRTKPFTRGNANFTLYAHGNFCDDNLNGQLDGELLTRVQHDSVTWQHEPFFDFPPLPRQTATESFGWIVKQGGCSFPLRDSADTYVVDELLSLGKQGKIIDTEIELPFKLSGGAPTLTTNIDTDRDGIPDQWETAHGLDPLNHNDSRPFGLDRRYTNIELYINSLVE